MSASLMDFFNLPPVNCELKFALLIGMSHTANIDMLKAGEGHHDFCPAHSAGTLQDPDAQNQVVTDVEPVAVLGPC